MKITFLVPHMKIAGGTRAMLAYAQGLSMRGHDVTIVVPMKRPIRRFFWNLLQLHPRWLGTFKPRIRRVPSYSEEYIPDGDVVLATAWQTARPVASFSNRKGRKFYLVQHYESLYHGKKDEVDPTYTLPLKKIVISSWLQGIMKDQFNEDSDLLITPVDSDLFHEVSGLREKDAVRVLLLHHNAGWKGVKDGIAAVKAVKKIHPEVKLVLFGVRQKNIDEAVDEYHYNVPQSKLAGLYSSCDIYLCPSELEGLGMPPMEAMACGEALVTYDTGGSRDYAHNGTTAFVADDHTVSSLASALLNSIENPENRKKIAVQGKQFIEQLPTWEEQTARLEQLFSQ